jgi:hypothetical protein
MPVRLGPMAKGVTEGVDSRQRSGAFAYALRSRRGDRPPMCRIEGLSQGPQTLLTAADAA